MFLHKPSHRLGLDVLHTCYCGHPVWARRRHVRPAPWLSHGHRRRVGLLRHRRTLCRHGGRRQHLRGLLALHYKLRPNLHCQVVCRLGSLSIGESLHWQARGLPKAEAAREDRHALLGLCLLSVPVGALRCAVRGVLAHEDDEAPIRPLPRQLGNAVQEGASTDGGDVQGALDDSGGPIVASQVYKNALLLAQELVDGGRVEVLHVGDGGHPVRAVGRHIVLRCGPLLLRGGVGPHHHLHVDRNLPPRSPCHLGRHLHLRASLHLHILRHRHAWHGSHHGRVWRVDCLRYLHVSAVSGGRRAPWHRLRLRRLWLQHLLCRRGLELHLARRLELQLRLRGLLRLRRRNPRVHARPDDRHRPIRASAAGDLLHRHAGHRLNPSRHNRRSLHHPLHSVLRHLLRHNLPRRLGRRELPHALGDLLLPHHDLHLEPGAGTRQKGREGSNYGGL
mmetsp:Transcript_103113/g.220542  ORF Transcript_103113/g.220542 Transcript_103113/m.220542 type:complete len:448 (+) Transcript_103113:1961-3304(+)